MESFQELKVSANGVDFTCLEAGEGPLVLCLHGFPDHARTFRHQMRALADAGYRAVAPFMRGYAPTRAPANASFQTAALARDVAELIDALGGAPAFLVGHDWGAMAGYGAAVLFPEKVSRLVAMAVPYGPQLPLSLMTQYDQQRRSWYMFFFQLPIAEAALGYNNFEMVERLWRDWSPGWELPEEEMAALKATLSQPDTTSAAIGYYRALFNPEFQSPELAGDQQRLGADAVRVPTLYLQGAQDGCIGADLGDGMGRLFPAGLRQDLLPGCGHFLHQENPEEVNRLVLEFLKA